MPFEDELPFLRRQRIALLVSCMKDCSRAESRGVSSETILQLSLPVGMDVSEMMLDVMFARLPWLRCGLEGACWRTAERAYREALWVVRR